MCACHVSFHLNFCSPSLFVLLSFPVFYFPSLFIFSFSIYYYRLSFCYYYYYYYYYSLIIIYFLFLFISFLFIYFFWIFYYYYFYFYFYLFIFPIFPKIFILKFKPKNEIKYFYFIIFSPGRNWVLTILKCFVYMSYVLLFSYFYIMVFDSGG